MVIFMLIGFNFFIDEESLYKDWREVIKEEDYRKMAQIIPDTRELVEDDEGEKIVNMLFRYLRRSEKKKSRMSFIALLSIGMDDSVKNFLDISDDKFEEKVKESLDFLLEEEYIPIVKEIFLAMEDDYLKDVVDDDIIELLGEEGDQGIFTLLVLKDKFFTWFEHKDEIIDQISLYSSPEKLIEIVEENFEISPEDILESLQSQKELDRYIMVSNLFLEKELISPSIVIEGFLAFGEKGYPYFFSYLRKYPLNKFEYRVILSKFDNYGWMDTLLTYMGDISLPEEMRGVAAYIYIRFTGKYRKLLKYRDIESYIKEGILYVDPSFLKDEDICGIIDEPQIDSYSRIVALQDVIKRKRISDCIKSTVRKSLNLYPDPISYLKEEHTEEEQKTLLLYIRAECTLKDPEAKEALNRIKEATIFLLKNPGEMSSQYRLSCPGGCIVIFPIENKSRKSRIKSFILDVKYETEKSLNCFD